MPVGIEVDMSTPEKYRQYLLSKGLSPTQAEGVLMNIKDESAFNPGVNEGKPTVPGSRGGYGLFQHTGPRRRALEAYAGPQVSDWQKQIDFAMTEPDMANYLKQDYSDPGQAAVAFLDKFERPAKQHRDSRAAKYLGMAPDVRMASNYGGMTTGSTNPMDVTGDPRTGRMDMAQNDQGVGQNLAAMLAQQNQPTDPRSVQALLENPLFQIGANIMGANGRGGDWMGAVGEGIGKSAQTISKQDELRKRRVLEQMRLSKYGTPKPTAGQKNIELLKKLDQDYSAGKVTQQQYEDARRVLLGKESKPTETSEEKNFDRRQEIIKKIEAGQLPPDALDTFDNMVLNQKAEGYGMRSSREKEEGKQILTRTQDAYKGLSAAQNVIDKTSIMGARLRRMVGMKDAVGMPQLFSWVKGSDPSKLKNLAEELKSGVVLDEMRRLKDASAQGATGFGAMSEKELSVLINSIASLDLDDAETFEHRMGLVMHQYQKVQDAAAKEYEQLYKEYNSGNSQLDSPLTFKPSAKPTDWWENYNTNIKQIQGPSGNEPALPAAYGGAGDKTTVRSPGASSGWGIVR